MEILPVIIFVVHAAAFGYFYFTRGRKIHNLLFLLGFLCLIIYHVNHHWDFFTGEESGATFLDCFLWIGIGICAVATPLFVMHLVRRRRDKID